LSNRLNRAAIYRNQMNMLVEEVRRHKAWRGSGSHKQDVGEPCTTRAQADPFPGWEEPLSQPRRAQPEQVFPFPEPPVQKAVGHSLSPLSHPRGGRSFSTGPQRDRLLAS